MNFIALGYWDIGLASLLLVFNAVLSWRLRLGLEKRLVVAGTRMVVQLTLVGLVLKALFAVTSPLFTGFAAIVMVLFAGREALARQERRFEGVWSYGISTGSMMAAGPIVTVFALTPQLHAAPWYAPRFTIPILGLLLGLGKHDLVGILETIEMDEREAHLHELVGLELLGLLEAERLVDVDHIVPDLRRLLTPPALTERLAQAVQSRDIAAIQLTRLPEQALRCIKFSRTQTDLPGLRLELRRRFPFRRGLENIERLFITAGSRPGPRKAARQCGT